MAEVRSIGWFGGQCLADYNIGVSIGEDEFGNPLPPDLNLALTNGSLISTMAMTWRIKKYRFNISWTAEVRTIEFNEETNEFEFVINEYEQSTYVDLERISFFTDIEKETDLVCAFSNGIDNAWKNESPLDAFYYDVQNFGFIPLWKDANNINPQIYGSFLWQPRIGLPDILPGPQLSFGYPQAYFPTGYTVIFPLTEQTINFGNGISFNVLVGAFGNTGSDDDIYEKYTINSWSLEAREWWEYDPNDGGGPIYNSVTGERMRANPGIGLP